MKPGFDDTEINTQDIDRRIDPKYVPKFSSPSGRILGMPDLDNKNMGIPATKDQPSSLPALD